MVTDQQVRKLMKLRQSESALAVAAAKAGMDEKTARKYLRANKLPSQMRADHTWRTREDSFADVWRELVEMLEINSGLEAKTLFEDLQRRRPGRFADGQLKRFAAPDKGVARHAGAAQGSVFRSKASSGQVGPV